MVEIGAQRADTVGVELIDATGAHGLVDHQPGVLEHLQVLRDGGTADGKLAGELADGARAICEMLEDRAPGRVAECRPPISSVSLHER